MTIYSLDVLLSQFGTSPLFHVNRDWLEARQEIQARLYWDSCCNRGRVKHRTFSLASSLTPQRRRGWTCFLYGVRVRVCPDVHPAFPPNPILLLWTLQKWQLGFSVSLHLLLRICPNCACTVIFSPVWFLCILLLEETFVQLQALWQRVSGTSLSHHQQHLRSPVFMHPRLHLVVSVFLVWMLITQSCPILCDPMDCSPPGSSAHGILQARILEWAALPFSRGPSWPKDGTRVSCTVGRFFTIWATLLINMKWVFMAAVTSQGEEFEPEHLSTYSVQGVAYFSWQNCFKEKGSCWPEKTWST